MLIRYRVIYKTLTTHQSLVVGIRPVGIITCVMLNYAGKAGDGTTAAFMAGDMAEMTRTVK